MARRAPSIRLLVACCVGVFVLLALMAAIDLADASMEMRTPLGPVSFSEIVAVTLAMATGGLVARARFRWLAVGLVAATGLVGMLGAWMLAPAGMPEPATWLAKNHAFALIVEMGAAWLAAAAGEQASQRLAMRREAAAD